MTDLPTPKCEHGIQVDGCCLGCTLRLLTPAQAEHFASLVEVEFLGDVEHWQPTGIVQGQP